MNEREREEVAAVLKRRSEANSKDIARARKLLLGRGIYDKDGKLRPAYGGDTEAES